MTIFPNNKKRFALLCVLLSGTLAFSQHTEVTLEDSQTRSGNVATGNGPITGAKDFTGTLTFSNHNFHCWAGPGATPTIDQAVALCTSLTGGTVVVDISAGYTGPESVNLFTTSIGYKVYNGPNNTTVCDWRANSNIATAPIYNCIYGGRLAGQLNREGISYYASSPTDSSTGITSFNWLNGSLPSNGGLQAGTINAILLHDTVTVGSSLSEINGTDSEVHLNATSADNPIYSAFSYGGAALISRSGVTQNALTTSVFKAKSCNNQSPGTAKIFYCYGADLDAQASGTSGGLYRNFSLHTRGDSLFENGNKLWASSADTAATITTCTESGQTATCTMTTNCAANPTFVAGALLGISGNSVSGYNNQWIINSSGCSGSSFSFFAVGTSGLGNGNGGTVQTTTPKVITNFRSDNAIIDTPLANATGWRWQTQAGADLFVLNSGAAQFGVPATIGSLNSVLFVDGFNYATCQAAVTAAGFVNKTIIVIPSSYAGAVCPVDTSYNNPNITILDFSGAMNPSSAPFNGTTYNESDGNVLAQFRSNFGKQTFGSTNQAIVNGYWITTMTNSTPPVGGTADGISAEMDTFGTLTGTLGNATAAEHSVSVGSTGGTITNASGVLGYVVSGAGSTTTVTNARGVWARGCTTLLGSLPVNCYGIMADDQGAKASSRNYAGYFIGKTLIGYSAVSAHAEIAFEDSSNVAHQTFIIDSSNLFNIQAPTITGTALEDSAGNIRALINGSGFFIKNGANSHLLASNATTTRTATFPDNTGTVAETNLAQTFSAQQALSSNNAVLTSDFTDANAAGFQTITGLGFTLAASTAQNVPFECDIMYSQATVVSDSFGIQDVTVAPTRLDALGVMGTSTTAYTTGNLANLTTTTATAIVTATPTVTTVNSVHLSGVIQQPSNASSSAVNIMVSQSTAANVIVIKAGSRCRIW